MDHCLLVGSTEEAGPVDCVIVTQVGVVSYVNVASTDLLQGLEM